jgi:hypothetical protein
MGAKDVVVGKLCKDIQDGVAEPILDRLGVWGWAGLGRKDRRETRKEEPQKVGELGRVHDLNSIPNGLRCCQRHGGVRGEERQFDRVVFQPRYNARPRADAGLADPGA